MLIFTKSQSLWVKHTISILQMPSGIPVATVAVDGAVNRDFYGVLEFLIEPYLFAHTSKGAGKYGRDI